MIDTVSLMQALMGILKARHQLQQDMRATLLAWQKSLQKSEGDCIADSARKMEMLMQKARALLNQQQALLKKANAPNLWALLQQHGSEREKALLAQLFRRVQDDGMALRQLGARNQALVKSGAKYVAFNLNVMTGAEASATYQKEEAPDKEDFAMRHKMFDASV